MNIVPSLKAFIYCAGRLKNSHAVSPKIGGDWEERWLSLRTLLSDNQIPVYLVSRSEGNLLRSLNAAMFEFAETAYTKQQLKALLSLPTPTGATSIIVGGCYAETLVTDVSMTALKQGYDTFVVWDRVWALSEAGLESAKARLLQAGAVPTSIDQVLHRWS